VNETVQLAQDIVGDMARGARFTVQINRNVSVLVTNFLDKGAQRFQRYLGFLGRATAEFFIINRQNECRRTLLLLSELREVDITGHTNHFHALGLARIGKRADTEARCIFRAKIFVNDDDGKAKLHAVLPEAEQLAGAAGEGSKKRKRDCLRYAPAAVKSRCPGSGLDYG